MKHRVTFGVTEEQKREIENYVKHKKRWADPAALARDAVWQLITRNPIYKKKHRRACNPSNGGSSLRSTA